MRNYLSEIRLFYQFVTTNYYDYKKREIKAAERTRTSSPGVKPRAGNVKKRLKNK